MSTKTKKTMKSPKVGDRIYLKFLDHSQADDAPLDEELKRPQTVVEFNCWLAQERDEVYVVELTRCNLPGNALIWQVIKSTIKELVIL